MGLISALVSVYIGFALLVFIVLAVLDIRSYTLRHSEEFRKDDKYKPRTLVIVPCKGVDLTLKENLDAFNRQKYRNYETVCIVDSLQDPAVKIIKDLHIRYIIAEAECKKCSKKVRAVATAIEKFRDFDVYVIADSDVSVDKLWLKRIVEPLNDDKIGISTMFPYFYPIKGFWSKVKLVWGFVGEGMMENEITKFGWGGSLAFRKDLLDKEGMDFLKNSKYSISDDICITKIAKKRGLGIAYTNLSQPKVNTLESFDSFMEWANRQTALSIHGYKTNFYLGIAIYLAEVIVMVSGVVLTIYVSPLFLIMLLHPLLGILNSYRRAQRADIEIALISLMAPFLRLANLIIASRMRSINWRGTSYAID